MELLSKWHKRFKAWKPIHLCWWFKKHGLPVPPYLIGGSPIVDHRNYIFADDDPSGANDPDSCTFDTENTPRTGVVIDTPLHIRIQVAEDNGGTLNNANIQLWYDQDNSPTTATQVTTASSIVELTPSVGGSNLDDDDPCNTIKCTSQAETWQDGLYLETSDETGKHALSANNYSEYQFCIQFLTGASGDYFFFLREGGSDLTGSYDNVAKITVSGVTQIDFADTLALDSLTSGPILFKSVTFADVLALTSLTSDPVLSGLTIDFSDTLALTSLTSDPKLYKLVSGFADSLSLTSLTSDAKLHVFKDFLDSLGLTSLTSDAKIHLTKIFADTLALTSFTSSPELSGLTVNFSDLLALTSLTSDPKLFKTVTFADILALTSLTSDPALSGLTVDFSDVLNLTSLTSDAKLYILKSFLDTLNLTSLTSDPKLSGIPTDFSDMLILTSLTSSPELSGLAEIIEMYRFDGSEWVEITL